MTTVPSHLPASGSTQMTVTEHLQELRARLFVCVGAVIVGSLVSWRYAEAILEWLKRPAGPWLSRFAYFSPTEALGAYVKLIVTGGCILSLPVILWQLWAFVRSGLTPRERAYGAWFVGWGSLLFAAGAAFAYVVCLPMFLRFLLSIGASQLEPIISIGQYLSFVTGIILLCGIVFELPLVMALLARAGVVTPRVLQRARAVALLAMLIVMAVATPTTDALSLILVTIPLALLYEVGIAVARLTAGRSSS